MIEISRLLKKNKKMLDEVENLLCRAAASIGAHVQPVPKDTARKGPPSS